MSIVFALRVVLVLFAIFFVGRAAVHGKLGSVVVWMCTAFVAMYVVEWLVVRSGIKLTEGEREALEIAEDLIEL